MRVRATTMTTRPASTLYPFANVQGYPRMPGPVMGWDSWAGDSPFRFDPLEGVKRGILSNANVVVTGSPASGKSSFVKALIAYLIGVFGCRGQIVDVKGEYLRLAEFLGIPVVDIHPGGATRVNLLDGDGGGEGDTRRLELLSAVAATRLGRSLSTFETQVLSTAVGVVVDKMTHPTLNELLELLFAPEPLVDYLGVRDTGVILEKAFDLRFAFQSLTGRSQFAGMFDGHTTTGLGDTTRGLVVNVSHTRDDDAVLRLAMLAGFRLQRRSVQDHPGRNVNVVDETWRLAQLAETGAVLQSSWKLGRHVGTANIAAVHRLSDFRSAGDAGSAMSAAAAGIVGDSQTKVIFHQESVEDAREAAEQAMLPASAAEYLMSLGRGEALVTSRGHVSALRVHLTPLMRELTYTNAAM